jgi:hypothetical protein
MLDEVSYCWPSLTRLWVLLVLERFRISTWSFAYLCVYFEK